MRCWHKGAVLVGLALAFPAHAAPRSNAWSVIENPTPGSAQAVGSTANGCLTGAVQLPPDGPGYEVIMPAFSFIATATLVTCETR